MRKFETMISEFRELDAEVLGSSTDAAPSQRAFAEHCSLTFSLVADFPAYAAAKAFGVFNEERVSNARVTFVIDKQGTSSTSLKRRAILTATRSSHWRF